MSDLENLIRDAYLKVQFSKNIWRKPGEPNNAQFRKERALLMLLKARKSNEQPH